MKKRLATLAALASVALFSAPTIANAATSSCTVTPNVPGFVCDVYEDDVTELTTLQLPASINPGYVVLLENGPDTATSNWSDIVHFYNGDGLGISGDPNQQGFLDFFSDPFAINLAQVTNAAFIQEDFSGITGWFPDGAGVGNQYYFHSDSPIEEPEPGALALIGAALLSLMGFGVMRRQTDA